MGILGLLTDHSQASRGHEEHGGRGYQLGGDLVLREFNQLAERSARLGGPILVRRQAWLDLEQVIGDKVECVLRTTASRLPGVDVDASTAASRVEHNAVALGALRAHDPLPTAANSKQSAAPCISGKPMVVPCRYHRRLN